MPDDTILHEDDVRAVIREVIQTGDDGEQHAAIADASVAHALNSTFSDTEVETALNALGTKINLILDVLQDAGMIDT